MDFQNVFKRSENAMSLTPKEGVTGAALQGSAREEDIVIDKPRLVVSMRDWMDFYPNQSSEVKATGKLYGNRIGEPSKKWAKGQDPGQEFDSKLFEPKNPNGVPVNELPPLLFDLEGKKVIQSSSVGQTNYVAISHVWGNVKEVDGSQFGIEWKIPIRDDKTLNSMLEAARIVTGERYVWMDVLCLDQRKTNEDEIAKMGSYFENAVGCFVWLDDAFGDSPWNDVLGAIEKVNGFFNLDRHGVPLENAASGPKSINEVEAFDWVKVLLTIEKAHWFQRRWPLQEGVVAENLYFCTPEKYMIGGSNIFNLAAVCELAAGKLLENPPSMKAVSISTLLRQSEIFKMLKMRQLYQEKSLSFWHVIQGTRSRVCEVDQDKVFATLGLLRGIQIPVDYSRPPLELIMELFKVCVNSGDFAPLLFFPGKSAFPDINKAVGLNPIRQTAEKQSQTLTFTEAGLKLDGVAVEPMKKIYPIMTYGSKFDEWKSKFPAFTKLDTVSQIEAAIAFDLKADISPEGMCPASVAVMTALSVEQGSNPFKEQKYADMFNEVLPRATLEWGRILSMMAGGMDDSAIVIIWDEQNGPQIAVISEPMPKPGVLVMPSSRVETPGEGCLVCQVEESGKLRKVGVGLGKKLSARQTADGGIMGF